MAFFLEREVPGIENVDLEVHEVALVGVGALLGPPRPLERKVTLSKRMCGFRPI